LQIEYRKQAKEQPRPAPMLVFRSSHQRGAWGLHWDVGGSPREAQGRRSGDSEACTAPTHYYVRVSRAETFTGAWPWTRTPPRAHPGHRWGDRKPGQDQGARGYAGGLGHG
jgi:hypothetical protein